LASRGMPRLHALAGVRCCSCDCPPVEGRDGRATRQRGTTCHMYCATMSWRLFVPFYQTGQHNKRIDEAEGAEIEEEGIGAGLGERWLYVAASAMTGKCRFEVLEPNDLHTILATHRWRISLTHINQLRMAYTASQEACTMILDFLAENGAGIHHAASES